MAVSGISEKLRAISPRYSSMRGCMDHEGSQGWRADLDATGLEYVRTCVWIKAGATPQLTGDRPACGHECIVIAHQTRKGKAMRKYWNGGGKQGVYWHAITADHARCHPAQKPLGLMRELVADFSDPGELVCDPYAGSGTTGLARAQRGRHSRPQRPQALRAPCRSGQRT